MPFAEEMAGGVRLCPFCSTGENVSKRGKTMTPSKPAKTDEMNVVKPYEYLWTKKIYGKTKGYTALESFASAY